MLPCSRRNAPPYYGLLLQYRCLSHHLSTLGSCPVQTYPLNPKIRQVLYLVRNVDPYQYTQ